MSLFAMHGTNENAGCTSTFGQPWGFGLSTFAPLSLVSFEKPRVAKPGNSMVYAKTQGILEVEVEIITATTSGFYQSNDLTTFAFHKGLIFQKSVDFVYWP
jgi:hypothetical protein